MLPNCRGVVLAKTIKLFFMEKFKKLGRDEMKKVLGGLEEVGNDPGSRNCYMCCDTKSGDCGSCDRNGDGGCLGAGLATFCTC